MKRRFLYVPIWKRYLDQIKSTVELRGGQGFTIPSGRFKKAGKRKYYGFRLEIKNGKMVNNISNSAVARDLAYLLLDDPTNKKLLSREHFFVRMNASFYCEVYDVKLHKGIQAGIIN
ncbi:hypothetical protein HB364_13515 [Pseudoflavitalea sp. X16]|uniref:hypothetical protein n=1 Tax=Paraflavitalea devenefica TaxID=2716334 RepID=UPI001ABA3720|nr:hypothetical protein [Paraflavitalea devenefica]NII26107.1 hypothetical protein [Paraflavitalea devenefica]